MRLQNKVALITGASGGIGRETALLFAREGAAVVCVDVNDKAGKETVKLVKAAGGEAAYTNADVSKAEDCAKMVKFAEKKLGKLHILWCNSIFINGDKTINIFRSHLYQIICVQGISFLPRRKSR